MKGFKEYLQQKGLAKSTVNIYMSSTWPFLQWLEGQGIEAGQTSYNDMLGYTRYCMDNGKSKRYMNNQLCAIRSYFEYLKQENKATINPASSLIIRGVTKRVPHDLLSLEQMEDIYNSLQGKTAIDKRNKVIIGLMVFQGLRLEEVEALEPVDIKLAEGKICIRGTRRTNSRSLKLEARQALEIQGYINRVRKRLLEIRKENSEKLIVSLGKSEKLKNSIKRIFKNLKKKYPFLKTQEQIRQSVISLWLKTCDIRQVQYMAGHKYVSSTERYQDNNLEDLHEQLKIYHPVR